MSKPSYKNLLKRSRSSIDPVVASQEDILQGIALACKARADGSDLLSSPLLKGRTQLEELSQIAQAVTESSLASKLINPTSFLPTLARWPSYPFDSNKELIRWLLGDRRDDERVGTSRRTNRRRKCGLDYEPGAVTLDKDVGGAGLHASIPSSSRPLNMNEIENGSEDRGSMGPMYVHFAGGRTTLHHSISLGADITSPQVLERAKSGMGTLIDSAQAHAHSQALAAGGCDKASAVEVPYLPARRACCIARDRCPHFGLLSVCGRRREMEDTYTAEPDLVLLPCNSLGGCQSNDRVSCVCSSFHFFGVYDGHGGRQASTFCKARLHKALTEEVIKDVRTYKKAGNGASSDWCLRWRRVMEACFLKIDEEVGGVCPAGGCIVVDGNPSCCVNPIAPDNVGTTAVVAVIGPCQIIVANCGDSRAVLSRGGNVVPLSKDHKPEREDEANRITAAGGRIIYWEGYRVGGLLAMSRAIGDRFLKNYVIAVPEVTCVERSKEDECLILASDGLWDVVSSEMACDIARRRLRSQRRKCANSDNPSAEDTPAGAAAALLTKLALSRGSRDNISVIVIDLKSHSKKYV